MKQKNPTLREITATNLLHKMVLFIKRHGMTETNLGLEAAKDGGLFKKVREAAEREVETGEDNPAMTALRYNRIIMFMKNYEGEK